MNVHAFIYNTVDLLLVLSDAYDVTQDFYFIYLFYFFG